MILISGDLNHQHRPLVKTEAYGDQVHLMVGPVVLDTHFVIISLVSECIIKTDVLSFWQHPQINDLSCELA